MQVSPLLNNPTAQVVQLKAVLLQVEQVELHLMHLKAEGKKPTGQTWTHWILPVYELLIRRRGELHC